MDKESVVKKDDSDLPERRETLDLLEILERKDPRYNTLSIMVLLSHFYRDHSVVKESKVLGDLLELMSVFESFVSSVYSCLVTGR